MALTFENIEGSPTFDAQSVVDATDMAALAAAAAGQGVYSGCGVTPQGTPNMTVQVAAGTVVINGALVAVSSVSSLTISAASSYDRKDLVTVNSSGTVSVTTGTPCTTSGWTVSTNANPPVKPAIPSNSVILAEVYVAASTTSIASTNIVDKTAIVVPRVIGQKTYSQATTYTRAATALAAVDSTNLTLSFVAPPSGTVRLRATLLIGMSSATYYVGMAWVTHGTSTLLSGCSVATWRPDLAAGQVPETVEWTITGLTAGTTYSIDLAWGTSSTSGTASIYAASETSTTVGSTAGAPVVLEALPA